MSKDTKQWIVLGFLLVVLPIMYTLHFNSDYKHCYEEGYQAATNGYPVTTCPYSSQSFLFSTTSEHRSWKRGWMDAEANNLR